MKLPKILAGPIIRRVEPTSVYIWIATSTDYFIDANFYKIIENQHNDKTFYQPFSASSETKTIQAREHLYINLIKVIPDAVHFPANTLIGYNLFFSNDGEWFDLNSLNLLSPENPQSIVYGNLNYPTFFIPHKTNHHNILYGSCRKPHGKGNNVLPSADLTIQQNYNNIQKRPSTLFLMGDQIYADDVADPFFYVLKNWSKCITGADMEQLTIIEPHLNDQHFKQAIDKIHGRQYIMETFCKFTSGHADNHLIQFSEYAAMYLMTFGSYLWENNQDENYIPSFNELLQDNEIYFMYPNTGSEQSAYEKERDNHQFRYNEQLDELVTFINHLATLRRILANTPTYMIFDDHDITDDWNINVNWRDSVLQAPLGKHVIANGLTAYWLFQGWGNDPDAFDDEFINVISHYLQSSPSPHSTSYKKWSQQMIDFNSWFFIAPTNPVSLFLDTRTMRSYEITPKPIRIGNLIVEKAKAPELIGKDGWELIIHHLKENDWRPGQVIIIVSPTPFYGIGIIESFLFHYVYPIRATGIPVDYTLDFEAWKYNGKAFNRFLQNISLLNPRQCIILSGDVHYAGSVKTLVEYSNKQQIVIHQFISSPIHNMSFSGLWGFLMKVATRLNGIKRRNRTIFRSCDKEDNLVLMSGDADCNNGQKWKEEIQYLPTSNGSIIETDNNIGLLTLEDQQINNRLLKDR